MLSQQAHPARVGSLTLIGCGTFDRASRDVLHARVEARSDSRVRHRLERLSEEFPEPDERLRQLGELVLMLHGAVDPHPGPLIREALRGYLPQIEYREWERCGHYLWLERSVQEEFFAVLRHWLLMHGGAGDEPCSGRSH